MEPFYLDFIDNFCLFPGTLIIGLMQTDRHQRNIAKDHLAICFRIYNLTENEQEGLLDKNFFLQHKSSAVSDLTNMRQIVGRYKLSPGEYLVVPSTEMPGQQGEFLLRIYSERPQIFRF